MMWYLLVAVLLVLVLTVALRRRKQTVTHAGGIVYRQKNGKTLFLIVTSSTNNNKWVLPKGRIEKGETAEVAAIREVREEAGVLAKPVKQVGVVEYTKKGSPVTVAYFLMELEKESKAGAERRKKDWVEKEVLWDSLTNEHVIKMIKNL